MLKWKTHLLGKKKTFDVPLHAVSMFIGKNLFYTITARNVNSYQYYIYMYIISYGYDA